MNAATLPPLVRDGEPIVLHRLVIRRMRAGLVVIIRLDGASAIRVDDRGAEAVRLIRRFRTQVAVQRELERRHGASYDISEILGALKQARMIRRWGSARLNCDRLQPLRIALCLWKGWLDVRHRLPTAFCRVLPPALALPLAGAVRRGVIAATLRRTGVAEYARRLPLSADDAAAAEGMGRHLESLTRGDVVARLMCEARSRPLGAWLVDRMTVSGEEHLHAARAEGRGAIVALLHQGPFPVIIPKLMSMGNAVHSFNFGVDFASSSFNDIMQRWSRELGYPPSRSYQTATPSNISAYLRGVASGGVGMLTLDYYTHVQSLAAPAGPGGEAAARGRRETAVEVPFGRRTMLIHTFAGFLARRSGAPVVPCACTWDAVGRPRLTFGPAVPLAREGADDASLTRQIFAAFAPDIVARPEEWTFLLRYVAGPSAFGADRAGGAE